ncbi:hypothetical protein [Microbacterium sp. SLBN-154]|uniref:hypothetical protein n=1 Tax=Microbacterium sp. SLBN-154 TaxID=2768458 RepID=UPI001F35C3C2|nr:hypothetical protein [Microbacterium sp. SLBN-154]
MSSDRDQAERMLRVMQSQQRMTQSRLVRSYVVLLVVWAAAWAIGFGVLYLSATPDPLVPAAAAWPVFAACIVVAIVWSITTGVRSASSGIRGASRVQGMLYGWSWTVAMVGASILLAGAQRVGLPADTAAVLYPGMFALVVGILYLGGGALWRSLPQYALGVVFIAVAGIATFLGTPVHYLVYAVVGPIAMLVVAVLLGRGVLPLEPRRDTA